MQTVKILCLLAVIFVDLSSSELDTLVQLHVLFRHGNRTPDQEGLFPTDPNSNQTYSPFGFSQLTTKGKRTEFAIGQYLRQTYGNFVPAQYTPDVAYSISTNFKRTKMSLELALAGLFPPLDSDIFYEGLNWQPIPFNVEEQEELIGIPLIYCTNFVHQFYRYILSHEGQAIIGDYQDLFQKLSELTGLEITTPEQVLDLYETFESEIDFGLELPEWTSNYFPEVLEDAAAIYFEFATATPGLRRLTTGHVLKKILDDSFAKRNGSLSEERKIFLYSAHDYHVSVVLRALNVYYRHVPPYGATVIFEIHNVEEIYGLKLYYQDYTESTPKLLTIPGCDSFCDLDKLSTLIADNFPGPEDVCEFTGELK